MTEILKDLRKAAEIDLGHGADETNLNKMRIETTKATKLARGTAVQNQDEIDEQIEGQAEEALKKKKKAGHDSDVEDETQGVESADESVRDEDMADIDGVQKNKVTKYDDADSQSEHGSSADFAMSEQGDQAPEEVTVQTSRQMKEDMQSYKKIAREKHNKYVKFLKNDFVFDVNKSASVTLSFPLEYKKLLLLPIAEAALNKVLVRNVPGIEKCTLVPSQKEGAEPYLFVQGINFQAFEKHPSVVDLSRL